MKKLVNECKFCKSRFCYTRIVTKDLSYDEIACGKHISQLYEDSDKIEQTKIHISSTAIQKRGVSIK